MFRRYEGRLLTPSEVPSRPRRPREQLNHSVAPELGGVHTATMTLKSAALLAFVGTVLITAFLLWTFISNVAYVLRGVEAPVVLLSSFIYAFGCLTLTIFFLVSYKAQS
jgi:hypothetical protein